jgi:hypothetical protein
MMEAETGCGGCSWTAHMRAAGCWLLYLFYKLVLCTITYAGALRCSCFSWSSIFCARADELRFLFPQLPRQLRQHVPHRSLNRSSISTQPCRPFPTAVFLARPAMGTPTSRLQKLEIFLVQRIRRKEGQEQLQHVHLGAGGHDDGRMSEE